jgi:hypothetical protein
VGSLVLQTLLSMPSRVDVMLLFCCRSPSLTEGWSDKLSPSSEPEQLTKMGA